jgi:hypothetical protein
MADVDMGGVPTIDNGISHAGTKRKAESDPDESSAPRRIKVSELSAAAFATLITDVAYLPC